MNHQTGKKMNVGGYVAIAKEAKAIAPKSVDAIDEKIASRIKPKVRVSPVYYDKGGNVETYRDKYNKKYGYKKGTSHDLKEIANDTGVSLKGIQQIYNKGIGAYKTNPQSVRPNVKSKEQWAYARVYSSVMGGKAAEVDKKELKMKKGGEIGDEVVVITNRIGKGITKGKIKRLSPLTIENNNKLEVINDNEINEIIKREEYAKGGKVKVKTKGWFSGFLSFLNY